MIFLRQKIVAVMAIVCMLTACTNWEDMEYLSTPSCDECYGERPDSADLIVYLTIDDQNPVVPLVIYEGEVEDRKVIFEGDVSESPFYLYAKTKEYYSARTEYRVGGKTVEAIDGSRLLTRRQSEVCDDICWTIHGGRLRLEYEEGK